MIIVITIVVITFFAVIQIYIFSTRKYVCSKCKYKLKWNENNGGSRLLPPMDDFIQECPKCKRKASFKIEKQ